MEYRIEKKGKDTLMVFSGDLTIGHAGALKTALAGAIKDTAQNLILDVSKVSDVDLSCLQLFCAAHRDFLKRERQLLLSAERAAVFSRAVSDSGYARTLGCHGEQNINCLWKQE